MVVHRQCGRKIFGAARYGITEIEIVLEGRRRQQFDADVVPEEILEGEDEALVAVDIEIEPGEAAVVRFRVDGRIADTERPVALGLRQNGTAGECDRSAEKNRLDTLFHVISSLVVSRAQTVAEVRTSYLDMDHHSDLPAAWRERLVS